MPPKPQQPPKPVNFLESVNSGVDSFKRPTIGNPKNVSPLNTKTPVADPVALNWSHKPVLTQEDMKLGPRSGFGDMLLRYVFPSFGVNADFQTSSRYFDGLRTAPAMMNPMQGVPYADRLALLNNNLMSQQ